MPIQKIASAAAQPVARVTEREASRLTEKVLVAATTVGVPILLKKIEEIIKYYAPKVAKKTRRVVKSSYKKAPAKKPVVKKAPAKRPIRKASIKK